MAQLLLRATVLLTILTSLGACAPAKEKLAPTNWESIASTRLHRRFALEDRQPFGLSASRPEIIKLYQLEASPWAAWILFDSQQMPALPSLSPEAVLSSFISSHGALIGSTQREEWQALHGEARRLNEHYLAFSYRRVIGGAAVRDNTLQIIVTQTGKGEARIAELVANCTGPLAASGALLALDDSALLAQTPYGAFTIDDKHPEWIAFADGDGFQHQPATQFQVHDREGEDRVITLLHADAAVLEDYASSLQLKPVQTRALRRSYLDAAPRVFPLAFATAVQAGKNLELGPEGEGSDGPLSGISLSGSRVSLNGPQGVIPKFTELQDAGDTLLLDAKDYDFAFVNAFVAVQRLNRFVRQFLSSAEAPFLDSPLTLAVNRAEGSCNAFYSPKLKRILLYKENAECANMALLNDVIYHEWGHALDDYVGLVPGIVDYAFSEGVADTLAAYFNDDAAIAPGFYFNSEQPVRSVNNSRMFPRDRGTTHFEGGIISGAFWDLRVALIEKYGKRQGAYVAGRLFVRHLFSADSYGDSYAAVLRLDDDDGRPETPSPNTCLIQRAFALHGLTPDTSCLDPKEEPRQVDVDLNLALWEEGEGASKSIRILAASATAARVMYCWAELGRCQREAALRRELQSVGNEQQRRFFSSEGLELPPPLTPLSLLVIDAAGQVEGGRQFVVHEK